MINGIPQYRSREPCTFVSVYWLSDSTCKLQCTKTIAFVKLHKQTCICFALLLNQFSQMVFFCRYIVKFLRVKWFLDGICIEIGNENLCGKIPWCVWALKKANDTPCLVQHTGCKYEYTYLRKYDIGLILDITELSTSPHQLLSCEVWTLRTTT